MAAKGTAKFKRLLAESSIGALHAAGEWLAKAMQNLVSVPCGAAGPNKGNAFEKAHSKPNTPPFMESGAGRDSIGFEPFEGGVRVGVAAIPGVTKMLAGNYMAGWDDVDGINGVRRPWLSLWKRYEKEMSLIIYRYMKEHTGAK